MNEIYEKDRTNVITYSEEGNKNYFFISNGYIGTSEESTRNVKRPSHIITNISAVKSVSILLFGILRVF